MKKKGPKIIMAVAQENQKVAAVDQKIMTALTMMLFKIMTILQMMTDMKKMTLIVSHPERFQIHRNVPAKILLAVRMKNPKSILRTIAWNQGREKKNWIRIQIPFILIQIWIQFHLRPFENHPDHKDRPLSFVAYDR